MLFRQTDGIKTYILQAGFDYLFMINKHLLGRNSPKDVDIYYYEILSTNYSSYSSLSISDSISLLESLSDSPFSKSSSIWFSIFIFSCAYLHSKSI